MQLANYVQRRQYITPNTKQVSNMIKRGYQQAGASKSQIYFPVAQTTDVQRSTYSSDQPVESGLLASVYKHTYSWTGHTSYLANSVAIILSLSISLRFFPIQVRDPAPKVKIVRCILASRAWKQSSDSPGLCSHRSGINWSLSGPKVS